MMVIRNLQQQGVGNQHHFTIALMDGDASGHLDGPLHFGPIIRMLNQQRDEAFVHAAFRSELHHMFQLLLGERSLKNALKHRLRLLWVQQPPACIGVLAE